MDFIGCNELYYADDRVYRFEPYITIGGTEINGEFSGPVPGKKAPEMPGNRQIGHLGHLPMTFFASDGRLIDMEEHDMRTIFESKVERIITNGRSTIVCWKDGTKTRVVLSAGEDTDGSVYEGFMWACVKKLFGSHRRFERLVDGVHVDQDRREEKPEKPARKPAKRACKSGRKSAYAKHL